MFLSSLFSRTSPHPPADADSINARLLLRAGYVQKVMAGVYAYLPLGLRVLRNIERIVREEMEAIGGQEVLMPGLSPRSNWEKTGRWATFDALFKIAPASAGEEPEGAINPTHEEVVVPLVQPFLHSYKDLPFLCYQIQTKYRRELRVKSGLLRGREFLMKDLYSFHRDAADLDRTYAVVQGAYDRIFQRLDIAGRTYLTLASGGSFSPFSHEYQVLLPQGEDVLFVSVAAEREGKRIAVNREVYEKGVTHCPVTGDTEFREERASEAANIFKLGTRFSAPFGLQYADERGVLHPVVMGCYGIGISRILGIIAEALADEHGLRWPLAVAPASVILLPLAQKREEQAFREAERLFTTLRGEGVPVLFDDRLACSTGSRFADADLLGIPFRVVLSPRTIKKKVLEVKDRRTGEVREVEEEVVVRLGKGMGGVSGAGGIG